MKRERFTEEQITTELKAPEAGAGVPAIMQYGEGISPPLGCEVGYWARVVVL
jgi:hypothetical protein